MGLRFQKDRHECSQRGTYMIETGLQVLELALLDDQVVLVIQILHNVVVALLVVLEDHGFDRGIALDQETW